MTCTCTAVRLGDCGEWTKTRGTKGGLVLNGPERNKAPLFFNLCYIFHKSRSSEREVCCIPERSVCVCVCVRTRVYDPFKIHHPFSEAALLTEGIGNDVVMNNHRFTELLRSASPQVQGCTNHISSVLRDIVSFFFSLPFGLNLILLLVPDTVRYELYRK